MTTSCPYSKTLLVCLTFLFLPCLPILFGDFKLLAPPVVDSLLRVGARRYKLHDRTVEMRSNVTRQWLSKTSPLPPAMLLLTNYGWNHPNQENVGLKTARSILNRELYEGVINHPWFHPTAWEDYHGGSNNLFLSMETRYYVFLDVPTCLSSNYPEYEGGFDWPNADLKGGRVAQKGNTQCGSIVDCPYISQTLNSTFLAQYNAKLVVPECNGWGLPAMYRQEANPDPRFVLVTLSSTTSQVRNPPDHGLIPPAIKPLILNEAQREAIDKCDESNRTLLLTFVGNMHKAQVRQNLKNLFHNVPDVLIVPREELSRYNITYEDTLLKSVYAAAPRGDAPFSYRFSEVLSAGAIPVVYSDDWVMPFRSELVAWGVECAVIIPEKDVNKTLNILQQITDKERCQRRRRCYHIYEEYTRTGEQVIHGIVDGLELLATQTKGGNSSGAKRMMHPLL